MDTSTRRSPGDPQGGDAENTQAEIGLTSAVSCAPTDKDRLSNGALHHDSMSDGSEGAGPDPPATDLLNDTTHTGPREASNPPTEDRTKEPQHEVHKASAEGDDRGRLGCSGNALHGNEDASGRAEPAIMEQRHSSTEGQRQRHRMRRNHARRAPTSPPPHSADASEGGEGAGQFPTAPDPPEKRRRRCHRVTKDASDGTPAGNVDSKNPDHQWEAIATRDSPKARTKGPYIDVQVFSSDDQDTSDVISHGETPGRDAATAQFGKAAKQYRQRKLSRPQMTHADTDKRNSTSGNGINGEHSHAHTSASRHWTCARCAHQFHTDAKPTKHGRAPTKWCPGCGQTRRVATATCSVCTLTWRQCQCAVNDIPQENNAQEASGSNSTRIRGHSEADKTDATEHSQKKIRRGPVQVPTPTPADRLGKAAPEPPEPSQRLDPTDMDAKPDARSGGSTAAGEPRSSHAAGRAPAAEWGPRAGQLNAQQHPRGGGERYKSTGRFRSSHTAQKARTREENGRGAAIDGAATRSEGTPGSSRAGKRRLRPTDGEGHRNSDSRRTRHRILKSPAPKEATCTVGMKQNRRTETLGEGSQAAMQSGTLLKAHGAEGDSRMEPEALFESPTRISMAGAPWADGRPTANTERKEPGHRKTNRRAHSGHKSNRTAGPPHP